MEFVIYYFCQVIFNIFLFRIVNKVDSFKTKDDALNEAGFILGSIFIPVVNTLMTLIIIIVYLKEFPLTNKIKLFLLKILIGYKE